MTAPLAYRLSIYPWYVSIFTTKFKKRYLHVHWQKISTATLNIAQTAHFHNYRSEEESSLQIWLAPQTSLVEVVVQFWTRFSITWFNIRTEFGQKMHSLEKYYMCTGNSTNWLFLRLFARVQFRGEESRGKLFSEVKVPTFAKESKSWCFQTCWKHSIFMLLSKCPLSNVHVKSLLIKKWQSSSNIKQILFIIFDVKLKKK